VEFSAGKDAEHKHVECALDQVRFVGHAPYDLDGLSYMSSLSLDRLSNMKRDLLLQLDRISRNRVQRSLLTVFCCRRQALQKQIDQHRFSLS
jgi:hypothetical protein